MTKDKDEKKDENKLMVSRETTSILNLISQSKY